MLKAIGGIALGAAALLAAGCGGGGGDSTGAPSGTSPPPPPAIARTDAFRFLNQATFGATDAEIQKVSSHGAWIDAQLAQPASLQLPDVVTAFNALPQPVMNFGQLQDDRVAAWFDNAVRGEDQLRQRTAFALSQIMVTSDQSLQPYPFALADYYDMLARNAFGDFRQLIEDVTLHPAMGVYLSMLGNQKPNAARNIRPDENLCARAHAAVHDRSRRAEPRRKRASRRAGSADPDLRPGDHRGLCARLHRLELRRRESTSRSRVASLANQIAADEGVCGAARYGRETLLSYPGAGSRRFLPDRRPRRISPMRSTTSSVTRTSRRSSRKQLIQRLVTSNPSPQYVERIARRFNDDGTGRRGNLGAVVRAILLDPEARDARTASDAAGKLKEPLLRLTQLWRAYDVASASGSISIRGLRRDRSARGRCCRRRSSISSVRSMRRRARSRIRTWSHPRCRSRPST